MKAKASKRRPTRPRHCADASLLKTSCTGGPSCRRRGAERRVEAPPTEARDFVHSEEPMSRTTRTKRSPEPAPAPPRELTARSSMLDLPDVQSGTLPKYLAQGELDTRPDPSRFLLPVPLGLALRRLITDKATPEVPRSLVAVAVINRAIELAVMEAGGYTRAELAVAREHIDKAARSAAAAAAEQAAAAKHQDEIAQAEREYRARVEAEARRRLAEERDADRQAAERDAQQQAKASRQVLAERARADENFHRACQEKRDQEWAEDVESELDRLLAAGE